MTKPLSSGIDTLVLAIDVGWKDRRFFESLSVIKERARVEDKECPGVIHYRGGKEKWLFSVRPYGIRGYEWMISSKEFTMRVGNWMEPETRPSIMVEIGSEALWRQGPLGICQRVVDIIEECGGIIKEVKISRVDLCVDLELESDTWDDMKLRQARVCRGRKIGIYLDGDILETFSIGVGEIRARLYDKIREIDQVSKKTWMYDIWGIKKPEEGKKVIRIEFQIRREVIKELGAGRASDFFEKIDEVWGYCTKKWLMFKDGKEEKHHTQRKILSWWKVVQDSFYGVQDPTPAVREKAIKVDGKQLRAQILGLTSSLTALTMEERKVDVLNFKEIEPCMRAVIASQRLKGHNLKEFKENVIRKRAKYARILN